MSGSASDRRVWVPEGGGRVTRRLCTSCAPGIDVVDFLASPPAEVGYGCCEVCGGEIKGAT